MERKVSTVIVTGATENYAAGVLDIAGRFAPHRDRGQVRLACLDLGLSANTLSELAACIDHVAQPGWDLPVPDMRRINEPHLRALTARPYLRDYFPGHEVYLWIDADVLVQQTAVARWYIQGALDHGMALVPQVHHAYRHNEHALRWRMGRLTACFGEVRARDFLWQTYYNAGIFALHSGAPHWAAWEAYFREGLDRCGGAVVCDQTVLNEAIHREKLPVQMLPAIANWLCHLALPVTGQAGEYREPGVGGRELGMVHFSGGAKVLVGR